MIQIEISHSLIKDIHYKAIKALYRGSFPINERIPLFRINSLIKKKYFTFTKYIEETTNDLLGFTIITNLSDKKYLFFLVVNSNKRNMGLGTHILKYILDKYHNIPLYLAAEYYEENTPIEDIRIRRVSFYKRNGLILLPYTITEFGVKYFTLGNTSDIDVTNHSDMFKRIFGRIIFFIIHKLYKVEKYRI